jgi:hypothetical protein
LLQGVAQELDFVSVLLLESGDLAGQGQGESALHVFGRRRGGLGSVAVTQVFDAPA